MHTLATGCKINLFLRVGERLPSGYHSLDTVFLPLSIPADLLHIEKEASMVPALRVQCSTPGIDLADNTLTKAFSLYLERLALPWRISVTLVKHVPHGAGLGGGSADAAGFLLFLQQLATNSGLSPLPEKELAALAARVGADVPFFLLNTPARATGMGEILLPCRHPYEGWTVLLVCPGISVATPWAFAALDRHREKYADPASAALTSGSCRANTTFADGFFPHNDFEEVVFPVYPELADARDRLLRHGAEIALMSGTGSSLFGLFPQEEEAKNAARHFTETTFVQKLQPPRAGV